MVATVMSPEEKTQFVSMQKDIHDIKKKVDGMGGNLEKVLGALMGNDLAKDGGLIARITELEEQNEEILKELETIKSDRAKTEWYLKLLWTASGFIAAAIFQFILDHILKK
jgi:hypothetical protein